MKRQMRNNWTGRALWKLVGAVGATVVFGGVVVATGQAPPATRPADQAVVARGTDTTGQIKLSVNKNAVVTTKSPYKRLSIAQPEIADVNPIGPQTILVTAKKAGSTQIVLWDDQDQSQVIDVTVEMDLAALQETLTKMFPTSKIEVASLNGSIALRGRVPSVMVGEQAVMVASPYGKVLNFLEIYGGQQVMLQVRFAEVSRSAVDSLGVNVGFTDGIGYGASNIGQVNPFGVIGATATTPDTLAVTGPNPGVTLFGRGQFGSTSLAVFVNALRQNNLLRMLAEPNLIAISGQEASFLAGGEFPIPVTQGGGGEGGTAVTVEYREFGVKLNFVPTVLGDGRIRLKVAPEVSDLDFTTAVRFNGFVIPGLTSRKVQTTIELAEGQTFAIAGLLNDSVSATKDVTPVLGDIPILGALFRSVRYQRKETELVVLVTPKLVEGMNPDQVPTLPGEYWRHPSEGELFWNKDIGGPAADPRQGPTSRPTGPQQPAPRYQGQYGYVQPTTTTAPTGGK
ncbi:MAG: type II and III secretion system protein family protein [Phycisphaerales bacterium]|nr:type II and III secretion system protein family protein [Phycisphaerales bacterium]